MKKTLKTVKSTGSRLPEHLCDWKIFFCYMTEFLNFDRIISGNDEA